MERLYKLDNVKAVLIVLVVWAHTISNVLTGGGGDLNSMIWGVVNAFHIPAFLIVSGYLSHGRINRRDYFKAITTCFIPYLFAQFGLFVMFSLTGTVSSFFPVDDANHMLWLRPSGALWYIFALGMYLVFTSVFKDSFRNREVTVLILSIILSLLMGFGQSIWYFRFTRVVCFYPFFFLGYLLKEKNVNITTASASKRTIGGIVFVCMLAVLVFLRRVLLKKGIVKSMLGIITMEDASQYSQLVTNEHWYIIGPFIRLCLIILVVITSIGLIAFMPEKNRFYTRLGENSIYIYILHWFLIRGVGILKKLGKGASFFKMTAFASTGYNAILIVLPIIIVICFILQSKWVRMICRPFFQPRINNPFESKN